MANFLDLVSGPYFRKDTRLTTLSVRAVTARSATVLIDADRARYWLDASVDWVLNGHVTGVADRVAVFLDGLEPGTEQIFRAGGAELRFRTAPCAGLVDAGDFGLRAVGLAPDDPDFNALGVAETCIANTRAFAEAVAAVPQGGTLRVPPGRYLTGPLFLRSDMTLWLPEGAELFATGDRTGWPILPERDDEGRVVGTWEGLPAASFAAPVTALGCDRLAITGRGVLDGGGDRGDWWSWPKETRDGARRPRTLFLAHCRDVVLSGITVRNSPSWTVHPYHCHGLVAAALTIENPADTPNTDGFDPESCTRVLVQGTRISVGDDCIAVKAGKIGTGADIRTDHVAPTRDLKILNCLMEDGHGAVVMGSEMSGDITDVEIARCDFTGTDRGLRIKTRRGRGGQVARIVLRDTVMTGVGTAVAVNAFYFCDADGKSAAVQSRLPAPVDDGTPRITDIVVENVQLDGVRHAVAALLGLPEAPLTGIHLSNLRVRYDAEAKAGQTLMACGLPVARQAGVLARFAEVESDGEVGDMTHLRDYVDAFVTAYQPYKGGAWCYEDGNIYRGLELLHVETGEARWLDHLKRLIDAQIGEDGSLKGYALSDYNIDNVLPGRAALYLYRVTGQAKYRAAADLLARQLATHPRTRSGVYWHKLRYPWQIWLDGLYMGQPFRIAYAQMVGDAEGVQDSLRQIGVALDVLLDPVTGLPKHAYDEAREQPWADPVTGVNPAYWARAIGWLAMALVDVAELTGDGFAPLRARTVALLERLAALRGPEGLWLQVIDRPDLKGNYIETSASAMFTYALLRAGRLGLVDCPKGLDEALFAYAVQPFEGGHRMVEICEVAGLGWYEGRFRDGSAAYYLTEARVCDDAKGVGPLMMALALSGA